LHRGLLFSFLFFKRIKGWLDQPARTDDYPYLANSMSTPGQGTARVEQDAYIFRNSRPAGGVTADIAVAGLTGPVWTTSPKCRCKYQRTVAAYHLPPLPPRNPFAFKDAAIKLKDAP
jgi:hypothetical protein